MGQKIKKKRESEGIAPFFQKKVWWVLSVMCQQTEGGIKIQGRRKKEEVRWRSTTAVRSAVRKGSRGSKKLDPNDYCAVVAGNKKERKQQRKEKREGKEGCAAMALVRNKRGLSPRHGLKTEGGLAV